MPDGEVDVSSTNQCRVRTRTSWPDFGKGVAVATISKAKLPNMVPGRIEGGMNGTNVDHMT